MTLDQHVDLRPYNTFGITAFAKYFVTVTSVEEAIRIIESDLFKRERHLILGGGSNILFTGDFEGLVVKVELNGIDVVQETENEITLKVGAGENWHNFVMHCVSRGWGGIENLSLIPGTVGAAPMQNIGAYGVELREVIDSVEAVELAAGGLKKFSNKECRFGYRESIFKQELKDKYLISSITLTLTKKNHHFNVHYGTLQDVIHQHGVHELSLKAISDAVIHIRKSKLPDPEVIGNAGSFFKNPSVDVKIHDSLKAMYPSIPGFEGENKTIKIPAAWLIEQCGWKGKTFDNIGVHKDQALVLVNYGGGQGKKIWELALRISESVHDKFGILLRPEVNVI